jgi:cytochrome P450
MAVPSSEIDIFSEPQLLSPYENYARLRAMGSVVSLEAVGFKAITRYDAVREALRDWRVFSSAEGVALDDAVNQALLGTTLSSDNPVHAERRKVVARPIGPAVIRDLADTINAEANALVDRLMKRESFDAVQDLAWHLPLTIVSKFVGLPEERRVEMLTWSEAISNVPGPNHSTADAAYLQRKAIGFQNIGVMLNYMANEASRDRLAPGSWGAMLYEAADRGEIGHDDVPSLLADYLGPSLDTTISALGSMVSLLIENPDQWQRLRADRSLIPTAVVETVRIESPIQWFSRVVTTDHMVDGVALTKGERVILLYGCANRDDRKYAEADRFDVGREAADHLGWGHGVHACVGIHLARLEMQAILTALLDSVQQIESAGEPERLVSTSFRALRHLPVRLR